MSDMRAWRVRTKKSPREIGRVLGRSAKDALERAVECWGSGEYEVISVVAAKESKRGKAKQ
jgi:hypothetical protein